MRRLVVLMLIALGGCFVFTYAFAAEAKEEATAKSKEETPKTTRTRTRRSPTDANSIFGDLEFLADTNAIDSKVKEYEGLEEALEGLRKKSRKERREWTQEPLEEKLDLVRAVEKQTVEELVFIRELAVEEGAEKTTAAIEVILLDRQDRCGKVLSKIDAEMKKARRGGRGSRRNGGRRDVRDRYREQDRYQEMDREEDMYRGRERDRYR